ncbi:hypothetical protein [Aeromicrobium sp. UC242_57]|uniref:hypothetical protein n=1 Tax=Aeromicrobium sp. UC242_57 TaxID=3374624 RepID=UPI003792ACDB
MLAGSPLAAADANPSADAKAGAPSGDGLDPRIALLLSEAYRHGKAMGGWGDAASAFEAAGLPAASAGIEVGDEPTDVLAAVVELARKPSRVGAVPRLSAPDAVAPCPSGGARVH